MPKELKAFEFYWYHRIHHNRIGVVSNSLENAKKVVEGLIVKKGRVDSEEELRKFRETAKHEIKDLVPGATIAFSSMTHGGPCGNNGY